MAAPAPAPARADFAAVRADLVSHILDGPAQHPAGFVEQILCAALDGLTQEVKHDEDEEVFIDAGPYSPCRPGCGPDPMAVLVASLLRHAADGVKIAVFTRGKRAANDFSCAVRAWVYEEAGDEILKHNQEQLFMTRERKLYVFPMQAVRCLPDFVFVLHAECVTPDFFYSAIVPLVGVRDIKMTFVSYDHNNYNHFLRDLRAGDGSPLYKYHVLPCVAEAREREQQQRALEVQMQAASLANNSSEQ